MLGQVIFTEFAKLRRSKVTWFSLAAISIGPLAIALFMWIVREPGRAAQLEVQRHIYGAADEATIQARFVAALGRLRQPKQLHRLARRRERRPCQPPLDLQVLTHGQVLVRRRTLD